MRKYQQHHRSLKTGLKLLVALQSASTGFGLGTRDA